MGHHNMTTLWLDLETYSTVPIKHGTHAYAEAAEVLLVAWAYDDEPVAVWDMTDGTRTLGQVQMLIDSADRVVIHNSAFDRTVLRHVGVHVPVDAHEAAREERESAARDAGDTS
jgi:DNA polymerase